MPDVLLLARVGARMSTAAIDPADRPPSVFERVHAVLRDLPAIGKNSQAPGAMGGYNFRGIEDITAALKPLLAKHGVFMVPTVKERQESVRQTQGGRSLYVVDLLVRFTFCSALGGDPDGFDYRPGASFASEVWGQGSDSGDKAVQKAMTSAFKTMLSITFCISDSEYDAERHEVPDSEPVRARPPRSPGSDNNAASAPPDVAAAGAERFPPESPAPAAPSYWSPGKASLDKATARCSALAAIGVDILKARTEHKPKLPELRKLRDEVQWHEWQKLLTDLEVAADKEADEAAKAAS